MTPSLYVHIPFCLKKCFYCDFFSIPVSDFPGFPGDSGSFRNLVSALLREIAYKKNDLKIESWQTVYIGGGTPSLLSPDEIYALASPLSERCSEFTIEANPEDLTEEWLCACRDAGINRLSLGIQSMRDDILSSVGRRGSAASNRKALDLAADKLTGRLSVDLISGLPGQTAPILQRDIEELVSFNPDHVSLYSLTVEDGTPLEKLLAKKAGTGLRGIEIPGDDEAAELWIQGRDLLEKAGYRQYEVSNFAKPGAESRHNMTYWNLETYIGAGPGATGTLNAADTASRFTNTTDIARWLEKPEDSFSTECISRTDCIREAIMMGMRTIFGVDRKKFRARFARDILDVIPHTAASWTRQGYLVSGTDSLALTRDGLLFLNRFLASCLEEIDDD